MTNSSSADPLHPQSSHKRVGVGVSETAGTQVWSDAVETSGSERFQSSQSFPLSVKDVHVSYGHVRALTGLSLEVGAARVCAVVGMNGSGKSTFFKSVMGLVPLQRGEIEVCGMSSLAARKKGLVGYVPQNEEIDHSFPLTVYQVVMMGRYCFMGPLRRVSDADKEAVDHALEVVGLTELAHRPIGALSGGQRKRVFVARAVAQGAAIMLLDEPFAGVDFTSQEVIVQLLKKLAASGTTLLVSTHDLVSIPNIADEVVLLNRKIVGRGTPQELLQTNRLMAAFSDPDKVKAAGE